MIAITEHAYSRAKERLGLSATAFKKLTAQAYCYGKKHSDTKGKLYHYIASKCDLHPANIIRVYGEVLYIFKKEKADTVLVTLYQLPNMVKRNIKL